MSYTQYLVQIKIKAEDKIISDWYFAQSEDHIRKAWDNDKFEVIKCEARPTYVMSNNGGFYNMKHVEIGIPFETHLDQHMLEEDKVRGGI